jgi:hypothetical protein
MPSARPAHQGNVNSPLLPPSRQQLTCLSTSSKHTLRRSSRNGPEPFQHDHAFLSMCVAKITATGWCNCGCGVSAVNLRAARSPQPERVEFSSRLCFCSLRGDERPCAE